MNDLELLRDLGTALDPSQDGVPPGLLRRVQSRIDDEPQELRRWRLSTQLLTAAAAVTAIAVAGVLSFGVAGHNGDDGLAFGPREVSEQADGTVDARVDASDFLLTAAVTVRSRPSSAPGPDSYVYTRSDQVGLELASSNDQLSNNRQWKHVREAWLSVDGDQDSWLTVGQENELSRMAGCPVTTRSADPQEENAEVDCLHQPAYIADAPTDQAGMLKYLCRTDDGPGCGSVGSADWRSDVFQHGSDLLLERSAPAPVRAAVFEALSALPSMEVVKGVTTVSGRKGTAVALKDEESNRRSELIFDSETYEVIGERQTLLQTEDGVVAGAVTHAGAVVEKAVVDEPGLRPDAHAESCPASTGSACLSPGRRVRRHCGRRWSAAHRSS